MCGVIDPVLHCECCMTVWYYGTLRRERMDVQESMREESMGEREAGLQERSRYTNR